MNTEEALVTLEKSGHPMRKTNSEIITRCHVCNGGPTEKDSLSINMSTGAAICNRRNNCGWQGHVTEVLKSMGLITPAIPSSPQPKRIAKPEAPLRKIEYSLPESTGNSPFLKNRGLTSEIIKNHRIWEDEKEVHLPYFLKSQLVGIKHRLKSDKSFRVEKNQVPTLYGIDDVQGDEIAIFEGEIDMLTARQCGIKCAVSVPFGAGTGRKNQWIDTHWDELEHFKTIYIALDRDTAGEEGAQEISTRLGKHRCKRLVF